MNIDFWEGVGGTVVGALISGLIGWWLQKQNLDAAKEEREAAALQEQRSLARSLLYKLIQVSSHLDQCARHLLEAARQAHVTPDALTPERLVAMANVPQPIVFTSDEISMLLGLKDVAVFNEIVSLDELHNSIVDVWALYGQKRDTVLTLLAQANNQALAPQIPIRQAEARSLVTQLANTALPDARRAWRVVNAYNKLIGERLGLHVDLQLKDAAGDRAYLAADGH